MYLLYLYTTANVVYITSNSTNDATSRDARYSGVHSLIGCSQISQCMFTIVKLLLYKGYHINTQCGHMYI